MSLDKSPKWKKIVPFAVLIVGFIMVIRSAVSLYELYRRSDAVIYQQKKLKELEIKQVELKQQLSKTYTYEFIENEARNKLGLVKPGETIVYLENETTRAAQGLPINTQDKVVNKSIFNQWLELFF